MRECHNGRAPRSVHVAILTPLTGPDAEPGGRRVPLPGRRGPAASTPEQGRIMTQETVAGRANPVLADARGTAPEFAVRFVGALLAVTVATVHVADQGGITALVSP